MSLIVFFGTARQRDDYARSKGLDPKQIGLASNSHLILQGVRDPIEVVMAGNYLGYGARGARELLQRIHMLNQVNGHTKVDS